MQDDPGTHGERRRVRRDGRADRAASERGGGFMKDVLGLIVTGGDGLLAELGVPEDAALTPFAGKYRFIDFALATLVNSDVASIHVASPRRCSALRTHLAAAACGVRAMRRPLPFTFHDGIAGGR